MQGHHLYLRQESNAPNDIVHVGPNLLAIHAGGPEEQERELRFQDPCDIYDLLDDTVGWPGKQSLSLPMQFGETRILHLIPSPLSPDQETEPDVPETTPQTNP